MGLFGETVQRFVDELPKCYAVLAELPSAEVVRFQVIRGIPSKGSFAYARKRKFPYEIGILRQRRFDLIGYDLI